MGVIVEVRVEEMVALSCVLGGREFEEIQGLVVCDGSGWRWWLDVEFVGMHWANDQVVAHYAQDQYWSN